MKSSGHGGRRAGAGRPRRPGAPYDLPPPDVADDPARLVRWSLALAVAALDSARTDPALTAARRRAEVGKLTLRVSRLAAQVRSVEFGWPHRFNPDEDAE